jgi:dihydropteroate synthase
MRFAPLEFRGATLDWTRPYIVGILNVTPDSFSDGGRYADTEAAVERGLALEHEGADIIDLGGESTRPGAEPVPASVESERVLPVVRALAGRVRVPLSIDTTKADVAAAAVDAGAEIVNDISGARFDPEIVEVVRRSGAAYVCGHAPGDDIAAVHAADPDEQTFERVAFALGAQIAALPAALRKRTIVDPGIGFGKRTAQNLDLIRRAGELAAGVACPVMIGPSRKRFLGELTGRDTADRDDATVGAALAAVASGAHLVRVHDVRRLQPALAAFHAIRGAGAVNGGARV